jgi:hypothetical protein
VEGHKAIRLSDELPGGAGGGGHEEGLECKRAEWRALAGYSDTCDELVIKMFDILLLNHCVCRH